MKGVTEKFPVDTAIFRLCGKSSFCFFERRNRDRRVPVVGPDGICTSNKNFYGSFLKIYNVILPPPSSFSIVEHELSQFFTANTVLSRGYGR